jgi:ABC superfamily ATP binding cassette transporter (ABC-2 subfamily)
LHCGSPKKRRHYTREKARYNAALSFAGFRMTRQDKGFYLTLGSQLALVFIYGAGFVLHWTGNLKQMSLGFVLTLLPLLYFLPGVWRRQGKPYAALALLAPLHLFFGGVMWLWGQPLWGIPVCILSISLQTGTILHNYDGSRRKARREARKAAREAAKSR